MIGDVWLDEAYFNHLTWEAIPDSSSRNENIGALRELHNIPFFWVLYQDMGRASDAMEYRRYEFLEKQRDLSQVEPHHLEQMMNAAPTVLEVLIGISCRFAQYFESDPSIYFGHMFNNLGLSHCVGRNLAPMTRDMIRNRIDVWMSRNFKPNGVGSPFPIQRKETRAGRDMRMVTISDQMNAYSAEHFH